MRDYIHHEFAPLRTNLETLPLNSDGKPKMEYDLERLIDDWVLMGFLVGNDFVPHLPHMHIRQDHLPLIYATYCTVVPQVGGYLTERGHIIMSRFEAFLV
jgi:5'-3' exoribonuclease 1